MKLIEVRRRVLLADGPLETLLPGARRWSTAPGEYTLPRADWSDAIRALRDRADIETLALTAGRLPLMHYAPVNTPFRRVAMPIAWRGAAILFLSPNLRRWRRVPQEGLSMWIRPRWCVLVKEGRKRAQYFVTTTGPVSEWPRRALDALLSGYAGVSDDLSLPLATGDGIAVVPRWRLVLPPPHADWLKRMCIVGQPPEEAWLWDEADLPLIATILKQLRLRVERSQQDATSLLALAEFLHVLGAAYEAGLATEEGIEQFVRRVKVCDLESFSGTKILEPLSALMSRAFRGDGAARSMLDYLGDRLALRLDWRDAGPLHAVILSSGVRSFAGRQSDVREHLLAIPVLAAWATVRTTMLSVEQAVLRRRVELTHYRALPFFGRLRITPGNTMRSAEDPTWDERAWLSLLTLPVFEAKLSAVLHPFAFSVGFLPWAASEPGATGAVVLERVVGCVAQVLRRGPPELDLPGLLCEDAGGMRFVLETRQVHPGDVPAVGSLIRFVARRAEAAGIRPMPVYEVVMPWFLSVVDADLYWAAVATATVRMHLRLTQSQVREVASPRAATSLDAAVGRGWLAQIGNAYLFRYPGLPDSACRSIWGNRRPTSAHGQLVERLRPRIHPLFGWVFGVRASARPDALRLSGGPPQMAEQLLAGLDARGEAFVSALGRDRYTLALAVRRLAETRDDLRFERSEDSVKRGGDDVPRTQYRIAKIRA